MQGLNARYVTLSWCIVCEFITVRSIHDHYLWTRQVSAACGKTWLCIPVDTGCTTSVKRRHSGGDLSNYMSWELHCLVHYNDNWLADFLWVLVNIYSTPTAHTCFGNIVNAGSFPDSPLLPTVHSSSDVSYQLFNCLHLPQPQTLPGTCLSSWRPTRRPTPAWHTLPSTRARTRRPSA